MFSFEDFSKLDIRTGTITDVKDFPRATKSAYQLTVNFGEMGIRHSSAQITDLYSKEELIGKQVVAVMNLGNKQIANFISECLVLGVEGNGGIVLLGTDQKVENGKKIH